MKEKSIKKALNVIFAIVCTIIAICLAVSITVWFRPLYYFDIDFLNIPENSGVDKEICKLNYDVLIDYNLIGGPEELEFPTMRMSETGRIHFEEVKAIFIPMQWIGIIGSLIIAAVFFLWKEKQWLRISGLVTVSIALIVMAAVIIDWEWAFETMHGIFFNNDYWIFNSKTDPVINILPDEFFMHCGFMIIFIIVLVMLIFEGLYRREKRRTKNG